MPSLLLVALLATPTLEYKVAEPAAVIEVLRKRMPEGTTLAVKGENGFTVSVPDKTKVAAVKKLVCVGRVRFLKVAAKGTLRIPVAKGATIEGAVDGKLACAQAPKPLDGTDCEQAAAHRELGLGETWALAFKIKKAAQGRMAALTKDPGRIAIALDDRVVAALVIRAAITDAVMITGRSRAWCELLATLLASGPLPARPEFVAER